MPECAQCHHKFMDTAQLKKHLRTHTGKISPDLRVQSVKSVSISNMCREPTEPADDLSLQEKSLSPVRSVESVLQPRARCRLTYAFTSKEHLVFQQSRNMSKLNEIFWKKKISHFCSIITFVFSSSFFLLPLELAETLVLYKKVTSHGCFTMAATFKTLSLLFQG